MAYILVDGHHGSEFDRLIEVLWGFAICGWFLRRLLTSCGGCSYLYVGVQNRSKRRAPLSISIDGRVGDKPSGWYVQQTHLLRDTSRRLRHRGYFVWVGRELIKRERETRFDNNGIFSWGAIVDFDSPVGQRCYQAARNYPMRKLIRFSLPLLVCQILQLWLSDLCATKGSELFILRDPLRRRRRRNATTVMLVDFMSACVTSASMSHHISSILPIRKNKKRRMTIWTAQKSCLRTCLSIACLVTRLCGTLSVVNEEEDWHVLELGMLQYLTDEDIFTVGQVCSSWREIADLAWR